MAPTIKEIARQAQVSGSTVSRVLNSRGQDFISAQTREKVLAVARQIGYRPSRMARSLRSGSSHLIGVLMDSQASDFLQGLLPLIERECVAAGYRVLAGHAHDSVSLFQTHIDDFVSYGVDGILCLSHDYRGMAEALPRILSDFPGTVFFNQPEAAPDQRFNFVSRDMVHAYRQATDYLLAAGRQRIALLLGDLDHRTTRDRHAGYRAGLAAAGLGESAGRVFLIDAWERLGAATLAELRTWGADAVLASNDAMALRLLHLCHRQGVRVPEDLAVIGCDNLDFGAYLTPALTTLGWDAADLARQLVRVLLDRIGDGGVEPAGVVVRSTLVVRESA